MTWNVFYLVVPLLIFCNFVNKSHSLDILLDNVVNNVLYLGMEPSFYNTTYEDCVWRNYNQHKKMCLEDVKLLLYSNDGKATFFDPSDINPLRSKFLDPNKDTQIIVHGYADGADMFISVITKAYLQNGNHNILVVDYSQIAFAPCYISVVNNANYIIRCIANYVNSLINDDNMLRENVGCVGHSMGGIICGQLGKFLKFKLKKFIALDPALPLITDELKVKRESATYVQTLHTNAGYYGDIGPIGHSDICFNDGNIQPYCKETANPNLCSHMTAVCYMAQSLFDDNKLLPQSCRKFCPSFGLFGSLNPPQTIPLANQNQIAIGEQTDLSTNGTFCHSDIKFPFCLSEEIPYGSQACCSFIDMIAIIGNIIKSRQSLGYQIFDIDLNN